MHEQKGNEKMKEVKQIFRTETYKRTQTYLSKAKTNLQMVQMLCIPLRTSKITKTIKFPFKNKTIAGCT